MKTFNEWLIREDNSALWTVFSWSKHHPKGSYEGAFSTEQEAFVAAATLQRNMENTGIYFKAVPAPEKHRDELIKYGVVENTINENICPKCGSDQVSYPRCCTKAKSCMSCKHKWLINRVENYKHNCCHEFK